MKLSLGAQIERNWRRQVRHFFFGESAKYKKKTVLLTGVYARRVGFMYSNQQQWKEQQL